MRSLSNYFGSANERLSGFSRANEFCSSTRHQLSFVVSRAFFSFRFHWQFCDNRFGDSQMSFRWNIRRRQFVGAKHTQQKASRSSTSLKSKKSISRWRKWLTCRCLSLLNNCCAQAKMGKNIFDSVCALRKLKHSDLASSLVQIQYSRLLSM